jgi:hypothetical protein
MLNWSNHLLSGDGKDAMECNGEDCNGFKGGGDGGHTLGAVELCLRA